MNQNIEKIKVKNGYSLPFMESFTTIQGEGFYSGHSAHFLRIGGCDVGCHWCDIKESWNSDLYPIVEVEKILKTISSSIDLVIISGGEPLIWNMSPLTEALKKMNKKVHLETSGAYTLSGKWDWICLSPKKNKPPVMDALDIADELKMIIHNTDDFQFAERQAEKVASNCKLYLQPEWSKRNKMMPLIVDYVMKNTHWKVSLQTHKYLNIP